MYFYNYADISNILGHAVASWLRHYATNRKVEGSSTDEVI
jgi:hypothetical protein